MRSNNNQTKTEPKKLGGKNSGGKSHRIEGRINRQIKKVQMPNELEQLVNKE